MWEHVREPKMAKAPDLSEARRDRVRCAPTPALRRQP